MSGQPVAQVTIADSFSPAVSQSPPQQRHLRSKSSSVTDSAPGIPLSPSSIRPTSTASCAALRAKAHTARKINDRMVYLEGPQVYSCAQCRTHLTSRDDIISKSFHGRHGRAYLLETCVNVAIGPAENRRLLTGLHSVCDISCKRCNTVIGWTYKRAYELSQKYKEGKFIVEKINLYLDEGSGYDVATPAGERPDRWRKRSLSWGSDTSANMVYEYSV